MSGPCHESFYLKSHGGAVLRQNYFVDCTKKMRDSSPFGSFLEPYNVQSLCLKWGVAVGFFDDSGMRFCMDQCSCLVCREEGRWKIHNVDHLLCTKISWDWSGEVTSNPLIPTWMKNDNHFWVLSVIFFFILLRFPLWHHYVFRCYPFFHWLDFFFPPCFKQLLNRAI